MATLKRGDKVVCREEFRHGLWAHTCAMNDRAADEVFTIDTVGNVTGGVTLEGMNGFWSGRCFRLATGLEEHQSVGLPAEDRLLEANAHIECLREKIAWLESELRKCCGTVADKPNLEKVVKQLSDEVTELKHTIDVQAQDLAEAQSNLKSIKEYASIADRQRNEAEDQRDAAVLAAKSFGEEVHNLRQDCRGLRVNVAELDGQLAALEAGVEDIDLKQLSNQLTLIGNMAYEQGNEADGKMCLDAAQVVCLLDHMLYWEDDE